jgi:uncharacterized protein
VYSADYYISKLRLEAHVEGGYFREIYRNKYSISDKTFSYQFEGERSLSTTIHYLLKSGQVSKFHKLKFDELWFFHVGSPLIIYMINENGGLESIKLGLDIEKREFPQIIIPANTIFGAEVIDKNSFSLVSCLVSPGFDYREFEMFKANELIEKYPKHKDIIAKLNGE